ncbi:MAG: Lrp/AsnC family transcriptional regulator, partial [Deltaproteobacteria bacterium]|nr:Lrp/AsnC family transcriptional regulator [Deltaproteobacteria bacterium]
DLEVEPQPFKELADLLGLEEEVVLAAIRSLMEKGYIRRFGATLRHQKSGFEANALVAWKVPEADLKRAGQELAAQRVVSHCYSRRPAPAWPYNLYTMIHGRTKDECLKTAARMAKETGLSDYQVLFSESELKKTTMRYFSSQ